MVTTNQSDTPLFFNCSNTRFDHNSQAAGKTAQLRSYADKIIVMHEGACIAEHARVFQRDQMIFDPWHYLPVLRKKPGALRNGAPFKDWDLPHSIQRTWSRLKHYPDWDRQLVDILACVPIYGLDAVASACNEALGSGSVSRDVIINLLVRTHQEPSAAPIDIPPHLQLKEPPLADCGRYDHFRKDADHATR